MEREVEKKMKERKMVNSLMAAGAIAFMLMPSSFNIGPMDRTAWIIPALEAAYKGPKVKPYNPALEAVHIMDPLCAEVFFSI
jgi:hypothetical protein